jgi:hypothetical protein
MFVVRTEGGGVYRVNAALVSQAHLTTAVPRRQFLRAFGPLFPESAPPLSCPSFSSPINKIVPTAERKLLAACACALATTAEERSLCVVGQTTVFVPLGMHDKLTALVSILSRSNIRSTAFASACFSAWGNVARRTRHITLIQARWRGRAMRQRRAESRTAPGSQIWTAAARLQAFWRGARARTAYFRDLLLAKPNDSVFHARLIKAHQVMDCAIQLRDPFAFERLCDQIERLHLRLVWMHRSPQPKKTKTKANQRPHSLLELVCCSKLRKAMLQEDYTACEREHQILKEYHDRAFFGHGKTELKEIEALIASTEQEMRAAIASRDFDLCTTLNAQLEKFHRFRSLLRDDETQNFSMNASTSSTAIDASTAAAATTVVNESSAPAGHLNHTHINTELEMLREELSTTRRLATALHNDRSHLEVSRTHETMPAPRPAYFHINKSAFNANRSSRMGVMNNSRMNQTCRRLSPRALQRHNQFFFDDGQSEAPSMMSSVSAWNHGGPNTKDPIFNFKITDSRGNNRRFRSSATQIQVLRKRIAGRLSLDLDMIGTRLELHLSFQDDEGEMVALTSDVDLQDAVEMAKERGLGCLRVHFMIEDKHAPVSAPSAGTSSGGSDGRSCSRSRNNARALHRKASAAVSISQVRHKEREEE